ncbi:hypothetical protein KA977_07650 [Candidatus Dependentiae bacterium]|nr:hypothetical protein [Candidatus Dependentiae bacterium]
MIHEIVEKESDEFENLDTLHNILKILSKRDIKNLPPDFFVNLNIIVETYSSQDKGTDFLLKLFNEMGDDEIVAFVFNSGERRNRPKLIIVNNDIEIDLYGGFFRKMVDHIIEMKPEIEKTLSKKEIFDILQNLFLENLKDFFDKEKLYKKFVEKV